MTTSDSHESSCRRPYAFRASVGLAVAAAVIVAALVVAVRFGGRGPLPGDAAAHTWVLLHRPAGSLMATRALTHSGTGVWPYLLAVVAGAVSGHGYRDRAWHAFLAVAVLALGQGLRFLVMEAVARPRPPRADWATGATGFSMPSGHSMSAALAAGLLCLAMAHHAPRPAGPIVSGLALTWAVGVGLSRVYLGVHWPSDVLTSWLLAIMFLALCTILRTRRPARPSPATSSSSSPSPGRTGPGPNPPTGDPCVSGRGWSATSAGNGGSRPPSRGARPGRGSGGAAPIPAVRAV